MTPFAQRYCAFIDILGFSARVKELEAQFDKTAYDRLFSCLSFMHGEQANSAYGPDLPIYREENGVIVERELGDPALTYVSDCLMISTERTPDGFKALCRKVTKIWIDLLWDGYSCRGAISAGPLVHNGPFLLGSGYMKAFDLEEMAVVPRVIIDKGLEEVYGTFPSTFPIHPPTMEKAEDGYLYLRYFPFQFYPPYAFSWSDYLVRARQHISKGLSHTDEKVQKKYEFLKAELNFTISKYREFLDHAVTQIE